MQTLISQFRKTLDFKLLNQFEFKDEDGIDVNFQKRKELILFLYSNNLAEDKTLIIWILKEELKAAKIETPVETRDICAFLLYKYCSLEDVYLLYDAKFGGSFDSQMIIDIELVFGYEKEQTKAFLLKNKKNKKKNKLILDTILSYEKRAEGKTDCYKSREIYLNYFQSKKIKHLLTELESAYDVY